MTVTVPVDGLHDDWADESPEHGPLRNRKFDVTRSIPPQYANDHKMDTSYSKTPHASVLIIYHVTRVFLSWVNSYSYPESLLHV